MSPTIGAEQWRVTCAALTIDRASQTSLRKIIGSSMLSALLSDRKAADERLRDEIGHKTTEWGVSMTSVEIRDVAVPVALLDAMSGQAQAEHEKQARVIAARYDRFAGSFLATLQLAAINPVLHHAIRIHRPSIRDPDDLGEVSQRLRDSVGATNSL
jgi:SPFH domain / Band 7 family